MLLHNECKFMAVKPTDHMFQDVVSGSEPIVRIIFVDVDGRGMI